MLTVRGLRQACPSCRRNVSTLVHRQAGAVSAAAVAATTRHQQRSDARPAAPRTAKRPFASSRRLLAEDGEGGGSANTGKGEGEEARLQDREDRADEVDVARLRAEDEARVGEAEAARLRADEEGEGTVEDAEAVRRLLDQALKDSDSAQYADGGGTAFEDLETVQRLLDAAHEEAEAERLAHEDAAPEDVERLQDGVVPPEGPEATRPSDDGEDGVDDLEYARLQDEATRMDEFEAARSGNEAMEEFEAVRPEDELDAFEAGTPDESDAFEAATPDARPAEPLYDDADTPDAEIEEMVRQAKERFRDTLPKDYLTPREYRMYTRLYGTPLRETEPEDVGLHMHQEILADIRDGSSADQLRARIEAELGVGEEDSYREATEDAFEGETIDTEAYEEAGAAAEDGSSGGGQDGEVLTAEELEAAAYAQSQAHDVGEQPGEAFIGLVARSPREYEALMKLQARFLEQEEERKRLREQERELVREQEREEAAERRRQRDAEAQEEEDAERARFAREVEREVALMEAGLDEVAVEEVRAEGEEGVSEQEGEATAGVGEDDAATTTTTTTTTSTHWTEAYDKLDNEGIDNEPSSKRYHPYTLEGHSRTRPVTIELPRESLAGPMAVLLKRSSIKHVREAAEKGYGGPGLPFSPSTPRNMRNGKMDQVGLRATQYHMTDIEADAFLAAFMAPAYSSAVSVFTEVRRRLGTGWMRNLLMKRGKGETDHGPSVLDYGMGGAGLAAWREVALAEWEAMDEEAREEKKRRQQQTARGKSGGGTETPADASAPADAAATTDAAATANAATPSSPPPPNSRRRDEIPGQGTVIIGSLALRARVSRFLGNTSFLRRLPDYTHLATPKHLDAPATPQNRKMFDIILVGHQLLPTEEGHRRRAILNNLWEMLNPDGGVLVVLERANPRGFEAVAEARAQLLRDFILPPNADPGAPATVDEAWQRVREPGFIVAPCTNHATCPMYTTPGVSHGRKDFCHFSQRFVMPHFLRAITRSTLGNDSEVEHSYVAVQRGTAPSLENPQIAAQRAFRGYADADEAPDMLSLPRMLLPPLKNKGHIVLDVCTPDARLERWTVPKSHGRLAYHDARKSRWGDLWALGAKIRVDKNVRLGRHGENAERQEGSGKGKAPAPERRTKGGRKPKIERLMAELEEAVADDDGSTLKRGKVVQRRKREEDE